jgi:branched-subunit amino acid transport protein
MAGEAGEMNDFLIIAAAGVVTWLLRASFITLAGSRELPEGAQGLLAHARPALLSALLATATIGSGGAAGGLVLLPKIAGVAVAGVVAWRRRNLAVTLLVGFAGYWTARAVLEIIA